MQDLKMEFSYTPVIPYEAGITRRDPSPVIFAEGSYHVWYSRATVDQTGYYASVYHALSPDGHDWTEIDEAISTGGPDSWDENGVFTPTTLVANDRYYLFYTAVPKPFQQEEPPTPTAIGVAEAPSPNGPWTKLEGNPVLQPGPQGMFDCVRVDDACFIKRDGGYWMYYKGRGPKFTPMGLAIAEHPTGPYVKHQASPLIESGREVCVWPCRGGVAAIVCGYGPNGNNIRFSADGIHFEIMAAVAPPGAPGPFRSDNYVDGESMELTWGISHNLQDHDRPYLCRWDVAR